MNKVNLELVDLVENIEGLERLCGSRDVPVESGYVSDLLSDVMRNAAGRSAWVTIQHHENVIAVALMAEVSVVIFSNGLRPEEDVIRRAEEEDQAICTYEGSSFELVGKLYQLGLR